MLLQRTSKQYGKLILLSGAHGLGKSILASKICERIRAFIKHSKTDARSFSFFNAAAMKSDRLIPMCVFRNIFIDMIGDYVDRVRFQEMENDEGEKRTFKRLTHKIVPNTFLLKPMMMSFPQQLVLTLR